ncbi:MAG: DDE transposase family protein [Cyanobacteria bacterium J06634_6]
MSINTPSEESWYIIKQPSGQCEILSTEIVNASDCETDAALEKTPQDSSPEKWGPFKSQNQAIAKRVGLIRAGKCQPS